MAWYPLATKKPIKPGPNDPPIKIIGAILHVDAGDSPDLYEYFLKDSGGIESHFHIPKDGPVQQYRDTAYEADANLKANSFMANGVRVGFASIETQGKAKGEWNAWQLQNIKRVLKWLSETHDFPLKVCSSPTSPGVGYHVMWGAPGPWTPHAKVCPGPDRVRQFENLLVPWFTSNQQVPPIGKDDMATNEEILSAVKALAAAETNRYSDLASRIQSLKTQEDERYKDYVRRFNVITDAVITPAEPPVVAK